MNQIPSTLTQHTVVIVVEKQERGIAAQALLSKLGFRVVVAISLYDALKLVPQEMPHLVICEATLSDGTIQNLFDKLQSDNLLKKVPMLAWSVKKTPDEINLLKSRKYSGAYAGPIEQKTFHAAIVNVINSKSAVSPFFHQCGDVGLTEEITLSIESMAVGTYNDQVVFKSSAEVDMAASLICVPKNQAMAPVLLKMASNTKNGSDIYNLFPINRIIGKGRAWIEKLPPAQLGDDGKSGAPKRRVIFYDPNEARFEGFRELLLGYGIELIHAKTLNVAASILARAPEDIGGIYLHELLADASSIEWKNTINKLAASVRPAIICGTTAANAKSTEFQRYIKRPFGMGTLVDMIEGCFVRGSQIAATPSQGVPITYQAPAKLIGLDESGGIIQTKFPLVRGGKFSINHASLNELFGPQTAVQVHNCLSSPEKPDVWHARFESLSVGQSKAKHWEKLSKIFGNDAA
jgi:hypothetical protein